MKRIPFTQPNIEATRKGLKTETRRIRRPGFPCPYKPGDILGIGESHRIFVQTDSFRRGVDGHGEVEFSRKIALVCHYQDGTEREIPLTISEKARWLEKSTVGFFDKATQHAYRDPRHRSSRFMPDEFIRSRIRVTRTRAEYLQDITPGGAHNEGVRCRCTNPGEDGKHYGCLVPLFKALWQSIHGKIEGERWCDNPEVWVIEYEVMP